MAMEVAITPFPKNVLTEVYALLLRAFARQEKMVLAAVMIPLHKNAPTEAYAPRHRAFAK
jgi:hypothetical protein